MKCFLCGSKKNLFDPRLCWKCFKKEMNQEIITDDIIERFWETYLINEGPIPNIETYNNLMNKRGGICDTCGNTVDSLNQGLCYKCIENIN